MDLIALSLPRLASGCQHGGLSSTRKSDHSRDAFRSDNMLDRMTLFVRQSCWWIARSHHSAGAFPKRAILPFHCARYMAGINPMAMCLMQPLGRPRHREFQIDHLPRRIARIGNVTCFRIDALSLKLDERW
ncbi:hypothetical protein D3C80_1331120 [compost metagenome]